MAMLKVFLYKSLLLCNHDSRFSKQGEYLYVCIHPTKPASKHGWYLSASRYEVESSQGIQVYVTQ